jgi:uncharacterized membrane protein YuzA (DUF378 family)
MCAKCEGGVSKVAWVLVLIGAINWGLIGIGNVNLVNWIFGNWPMIERVIYAVVGVAAVYAIITSCRGCGKGGCGGSCSCGGGEGKKACPMCGKSPCMCGGKKDMTMSGSMEKK